MTTHCIVYFGVDKRNKPRIYMPTFWREQPQESPPTEFVD